MTWHMINSIEVKMKGLEMLIKPVFFSSVYLFCLSAMDGMGSPLNPTIAFGLYIWDLGAYNTKPKGSEITIFEINNYGTYVWIYIFAPLLAGLIGGLLVKKIKDIYGYQDAPGAHDDGSSVRSVRRVGNQQSHSSGSSPKSDKKNPKQPKTQI